VSVGSAEYDRKRREAVRAKTSTVNLTEETDRQGSREIEEIGIGAAVGPQRFGVAGRVGPDEKRSVIALGATGGDDDIAGRTPANGVGSKRLNRVQAGRSLPLRL